MGIEWLSGSQIPNALALLCAAIVSVAMLFNRKLHPKLSWVLVGVSTALATTVIVKNVAYNLIVSQPNAQNDSNALHSYANVMCLIAIVQVVLGLCFLASSPKPKIVDWIANSTAVACLYAAICSLDWRYAYLWHSANTPVHYTAVIPVLHWVFVVMFAGFVGMTIYKGIQHLHLRNNN